MNIFVTDPDPILSAKVFCDQRLIKMIPETTQLLSTVFLAKGCATIFNSVDVKHPCAVWTRESKANYEWLLIHWLALNEEYTERYNKKHKCQIYHNYLTTYYKVVPSSTKKLTPFVNNSAFKTESNVHKAYRQHLSIKWTNQIRKPRWHGIEKDFQIELDKLSKL